MNPLDPSARLRRADDIVLRRVGDEMVLVPVGESVADLTSIYTLNEVGAFVWEALDGARTLETIVEAVCDEFEVEQEQARADVLPFVTSLLEEDLVVVVEGA